MPDSFLPHIVLLAITVLISIFAFRDSNLMRKLILYPYNVFRKKEWYRVITHAFIHADTMHLFFNMLALWSFGGFVFYKFSENFAAPQFHFYMMYFLAIIFSSLADLIKQKNNINYMSLGASGAVSAVIFSSILFNPWSMIYVFFIPCPGILFGVIYLWYSSYMGKRGGDRINHDAHFYGSVFGILYPLILKPELMITFFNAIINPHFI